MNLDKIVAITGKPGLYKIIAETPKRIIVASLEEPSKKLPVSSNFQLAMLDKITIYTVDGSDLALPEVMEAIHKGGENLEIPEPKSPGDTLRAFFLEVAPKHDPDRVYLSDIQKIIKWYQLLKKLNVLE